MKVLGSNDGLRRLRHIISRNSEQFLSFMSSMIFQLSLARKIVVELIKWSVARGLLTKNSRDSLNRR